MGSFQKHRFCVGQLSSELPEVCLSQIPSGGVTGTRSYTGFEGGLKFLNSGPHAAQQAVFSTEPQPSLSLLNASLSLKQRQMGCCLHNVGQEKKGLGKAFGESG